MRRRWYWGAAIAIIGVVAFLLADYFLFHHNPNHWTLIEETEERPALQKGFVENGELVYFRLEYEEMLAALEKIQSAKEVDDTDKSFQVIDLPLPDGSVQAFKVWESSIMEEELQARYPEIRTFAGQGIDNKTATARLEITSSGLSGVIISCEGSSYFTAADGDKEGRYLCYSKQSLSNSGAFQEAYELDSSQNNTLVDHDISILQKTGPVLSRTLRIAIASTVEHTKFFGSKRRAFENITRAVNRVNAIYKRDFALSFILVNNNDTLLFEKKDRYDNKDAKKMAQVNQSVLDQLIGTNNYDIGHVFGTGNGGFGRLASACLDSIKGMGATGLDIPKGERFYVDYFAHELGHQLGANHSFASISGECRKGKWPETAYEPGSGSTIMGYAGMCGIDKVQDNSDDYFHSISLIEINRHLDYVFSLGYGQSMVTNNQHPKAQLAQPEYWIPTSTPYFLEADGWDDDVEDQIIYTWEQFDQRRPLVRSIEPDTGRFRYIPNMDSAISQQRSRWEKISNDRRELNFNVILRDNRADYGGLTAQSLIIHVEKGERFEVLRPRRSNSFRGGESITVRWKVAKTRRPPISCESVAISISTDGGKTFRPVAADLPNNGRADIELPNEDTTEAVIMIYCPDNIFFAVSQRFTIDKTSWFEAFI